MRRRTPPDFDPFRLNRIEVPVHLSMIFFENRFPPSAKPEGK
jgi:hypothetical protein